MLSFLLPGDGPRRVSANRQRSCLRPGAGGRGKMRRFHAVEEGRSFRLKYTVYPRGKAPLLETEHRVNDLVQARAPHHAHGHQ